jgi:transcriptional regulator with XRE-family HTH domain
MSTGYIVRILRAFKNLSQPQLSYRANLSQFTISAIETGRRQPTRAHLAALEDGLGVKFTDPRLTRGLQLIEEALA